MTYEDAETGQFTLSNLANTRTVSEGIRFVGLSELTFSSFHTLPRDVYYWVLPERFKGDKVLLWAACWRGECFPEGGSGHQVPTA